MKLEQVLGSRIVKYEGGSYLKIERDMDEIEAPSILRYLRENQGSLTRERIRKVISPLYPEISPYKRNLLFFDIETTGLKRDLTIFSISLAYFDNEGIKTELLFARDPGEENLILGKFLEIIREYKERKHCAFLTYNGHSYDLPRISERAKNNRLFIPGYNTVKDWINGEHVDLYRILMKRKRITHHAIRKLQDLEILILGHERREDIPGRKIPKVYMEYVNGVNAEGEKIGRNDLCPCGSGKTYVECCGRGEPCPCGSGKKAIDCCFVSPEAHPEK